MLRWFYIEDKKGRRKRRSYPLICERLQNEKVHTLHTQCFSVYKILHIKTNRPSRLRFENWKHTYTLCRLLSRLSLKRNWNAERCVPVRMTLKTQRSYNPSIRLHVYVRVSLFPRHFYAHSRPQNNALVVLSLTNIKECY